MYSGGPFLAGVGDGSEAGAGGAVEHLAELLRGMTHLSGIETDAEDHVPVRERLLERRHRVIGRAIAQEAHDEVRCHPEFSRLGQRRTDSAHDGFELHAASGMGLRVEEDLDVTNALLASAG